MLWKLMNMKMSSGYNIPMRLKKKSEYTSDYFYKTFRIFFSGN